MWSTASSGFNGLKLRRAFTLKDTGNAVIRSSFLFVSVKVDLPEPPVIQCVLGRHRHESVGHTGFSRKTTYANRDKHAKIKHTKLLQTEALVFCSSSIILLCWEGFLHHVLSMRKYLFSVFSLGKSFGRAEKPKNQESRSDVSKTGSLINVSSGEAPFLEVQWPSKVCSVLLLPPTALWIYLHRSISACCDPKEPAGWCCALQLCSSWAECKAVYNPQSYLSDLEVSRGERGWCPESNSNRLRVTNLAGSAWASDGNNAPRTKVKNNSPALVLHRGKYFMVACLE